MFVFLCHVFLAPSVYKFTLFPYITICLLVHKVSCKPKENDKKYIIYNLLGGGVGGGRVFTPHHWSALLGKKAEIIVRFYKCITWDKLFIKLVPVDHNDRTWGEPTQRVELRPPLIIYELSIYHRIIYLSILNYLSSSCPALTVIQLNVAFRGETCNNHWNSITVLSWRGRQCFIVHLCECNIF